MDRTRVRNVRIEQLATALRRADLSRTVIAYDFGSDEFLILLDGGARPGLSRLLGGGWMLRVDRETGEPIGLQVEHFLSRAVVEHPQLLSLLDIADLTGISGEELASVRRKVMEDHREQAMSGAIELLTSLTSAAD